MAYLLETISLIWYVIKDNKCCMSALQLVSSEVSTSAVKPHRWMAENGGYVHCMILHIVLHLCSCPCPPLKLVLFGPPSNFKGLVSSDFGDGGECFRMYYVKTKYLTGNNAEPVFLLDLLFSVAVNFLGDTFFYSLLFSEFCALDLFFSTVSLLEF